MGARADNIAKSLNKVSYIIEKERELRFETGSMHNSSFIELEAGTAEILGTELLVKNCYEFLPGTKATIFTWHGCVLNIYGSLSVADKVENPTVKKYLSVHSGLNVMRLSSRLGRTKGPRVLLVGPVDVGKSSMCKILINYAVRSGWSPVFVDLDVGQNEISIPGTMGALVISEQTDIEAGYTSDDSAVYHFGYESPGGNPRHYKFLIKQIAQFTETKCKGTASGVIINTCGWVAGEGYKCLLKAAYAFEVDVVIVLGQELLYTNLASDLPSFIKILMLPKSDNVVERSKQMRMERRAQMMRTYFYGIRDNFIPYKLHVCFADIQIFRIVSLDSSTNNESKHIECAPVSLDEHLINRVASISSVDLENNRIVCTAVIGFVAIIKIEMENQRLIMLSQESCNILSRTALILMEGISYYDK